MKKYIDQIDKIIAPLMEKWSIPAIRISFGIIFIWFGILKPLHLSPAEDFLKKTVTFLPFGTPDFWLIVIGWWEIIIGITFLFNKTTRIAIALLFMQMVGTFMPLVFLPEATFKNGNPFVLTMEGQYIIKNVMIISAALVLGGRYNPKKQF